MTMISVDQEKCARCRDCVLMCSVAVHGNALPPCQAKCPLHTDVQGYLSLIAQGKFREALALNREVNPLSTVCGRVCTHPCEAACLRGQVDEPVAICALKRFLAENELECGQSSLPSAVARSRSEKVVIVGGGPAGLAAAHDLARLGYPVTIFEAEPALGGMLYWAIPEYRLPAKLVELEIERIIALGIMVKTGVCIGNTQTLDGLLADGFKAVLVAVGAGKSSRLGVPGEADISGVVPCLAFLREVRAGGKPEVGDKVIVVGGGNAAIDSARTALRLGATDVRIAYRRSRAEMPALPGEIEEAEREGVSIEYLVMPERLVSRDGKGIAIQMVRARLGGQDESGRPRPVPVAGTEFTMDADTVILATGQEVDAESLARGQGIGLSGNGLILADAASHATSRAGVFAAGDAVTGPATVVEAIAAGKSAALSIHHFLRGTAAPGMMAPGDEAKLETITGVFGKVPARRRPPSRQLSPKERVASFKETDAAFSLLEAQNEARRCLGCGIFGAMDAGSCCGITCRQCMNSCWKGAITIAGSG